MKAVEYVEDLIDRLGRNKAELSLQNAVEHHKTIYKIHKSPKSITTIKFFENCLTLISK